MPQTDSIAKIVAYSCVVCCRIWSFRMTYSNLVSHQPKTVDDTSNYRNMVRVLDRNNMSILFWCVTLEEAYDHTVQRGWMIHGPDCFLKYSYCKTRSPVKSRSHLPRGMPIWQLLIDGMNEAIKSQDCI
jgi:hypothetical protein